MHAPLRWIDDALADLTRRGLRRELKVRYGPQGPILANSSQSWFNFSSNDYLGLAAEPLADAVIEALRRAGWGAAASPLVTGRGAYHASLEAKLAEFEESAAALVFSSGYAANIGAITALVGKGDTVFSDAKNHASIVDGCRLSGARISVYPHSDHKTLQQQLAQDVGQHRRLIVTDGLFSMDGDLAPLPQLAALAEQYQTMLMVDEAHATGVFGDHGRGASELLGVEDRVSLRVGTFSKALGSIGGFVVGPQPLIDWLANRARPYVYSTAMPEPAAAAASEALRLVRDEPHRRRQLLDRATELREQLAAQGWDVSPSSSQIVPVHVGDPGMVTRMSDELCRRGFWVPAIRPPSVPVGDSLLRISLSYAHTNEIIDKLVAAMGVCRRELVS